jgi:hypothetical protein
MILFEICILFVTSALEIDFFVMKKIGANLLYLNTG